MTAVAKLEEEKESGGQRIPNGVISICFVFSDGLDSGDNISRGPERQSVEIIAVPKVSASSKALGNPSQIEGRTKIWALLIHGIGLSKKPGRKTLSDRLSDRI